MLQLRTEFTSPTKKRVSYSLSELSEGQRCLISLYTILHFRIERGDTVFIDEPDNFIALREIQPWLLSAEEAVEEHNGQLILVSHHPETLNQWAVSMGFGSSGSKMDRCEWQSFRPMRTIFSLRKSSPGDGSRWPSHRK